MSIPVIKNINVGDSKNRIVSCLLNDNFLGVSAQEIKGVIKHILPTLLRRLSVRYFPYFLY
jgi:hypothetical protein